MADDLHVAIIPDGNRRWAAENGVSAYEGHVAGSDRATEMLDWVDDFPEIGHATIWGLSRDNYVKRDEDEVAHLDRIYEEYARNLNEPGARVHRYGVDVDIIGDRSVLGPGTLDAVEDLERDTAGYDRVDLTIALGYDAAWDIDQAIAESGERGDTRDYREFLEMDDIDVLMGYGPDRAHLSGFAPATTLKHATLVFPGTHWPDAEKADLSAALDTHRDREKSRGR